MTYLSLVAQTAKSAVSPTASRSSARLIAAVFLRHDALAKDMRGRKLSADFGHGIFGGETVFPAQVLDRGRVLDELIGPADLDDWRGNSLLVEEFQHRAAVAPRHDMVFKSYDHLR